MKYKGLIVTAVGLSLLLSGCSAASSISKNGDILLANYDIKQVEMVELKSYTHLNLSGPQYNIIQGEEGEASDVSSGSSVNYDYQRLIIVGDSRTCGMYSAVTNKNVSSSTIVYSNNDRLEYFVCKSSQGFNWMKSTASKEVSKLVQDKTAVVFWLGVNDIASGSESAAETTAKNYARYIKKYADDWDCDAFVLCVTPSSTTSRAILNRNSVAFNRKLKVELGNAAKFLDNYDDILAKIKSGECKLDSEGIHYDAATSRSIYDFIKAKVGSIGINTDSNGSINPINGLSEDILFFTQFESGDAGYAQTGGDTGRACGKYQFDYEHSQIPFFKYCKQQDEENGTTFFSELYKFISYSIEDLYKYRSDVHKAWKSTYDKHPKEFMAAQDAFAYDNYYVKARNSLASKGIDLDKRSDVVKGSVYSYAIQHGPESAALDLTSGSNAVNNSISDKEFIKRVYSIRRGKHPTYSARYDQEEKEALSRL